MDNAVSCPVCTLYLREGVSLHTHLNTHPKDQVIEALMKYCSNVREGNAQSEIEAVLAAQYSGEQNDQQVGEATESGGSQQYPSNGHFTAAVTYQQFMSSNASVGGAVLPQCFSVPAIIATPAGEVGPATLMPLLYNPYVIQQQQQQQQQQLQFYNAFRTVPQQPLTRQILSPPALFPITPQFSVGPSGNPVFQNNIPVSSSSTTALQSGESAQSNSSVFVPSSTNGCQEPKRTDKDQSTVPSATDLSKYKDGAEEKQNSLKHGCQSSNSQENNDVQEQNVPNSNEAETETETETVALEENSEKQVAEPSVCVKSGSSNNEFGGDSSEKVVPGSCDKTCESEDGNEFVDDDAACSADLHFNPVSPSLRVRTDLSKISSDTRDDITEDNKNSEVDTCMDTEINEQRGNFAANIDKCNDGEGWGFLSEAEKSTSEVCSIASGEKDSSEYITSDLYTDEAVESVAPHENQPLPAGNVDGRHFKVVDIEGIHVLVPTHFLAADAGHAPSDNHESVVKPSSQENSCRDQAADCDVDVNIVVNPDIQTDEVMPPMGELSGQESLGENDTSSWSQSLSHCVTEEDSAMPCREV